MIKELNIKNFAIIDSLLIRFDPTFNVITGDTGAGKTLIIKAIDILLGAQFNKKMIRVGQVVVSKQEDCKSQKEFKRGNELKGC